MSQRDYQDFLGKLVRLTAETSDGEKILVEGILSKLDKFSGPDEVYEIDLVSSPSNGLYGELTGQVMLRSLDVQILKEQDAFAISQNKLHAVKERSPRYQFLRRR